MAEGSPSVRISVVIPAYEEEQRLAATLERVTTFLEKRAQPFEVLVVDDGSDDGTSSIASRFVDRGVVALRLPQNRGKGAALRHGVSRSRGDWVLLCDADLSTPIEDLALLEARTGEAEVILGSRAVVDSNVTRRQPLYRELMGKTFNRIIRALALVSEHDTQCGFKLIRGDIARELFSALTIERFACDVEVVCLARDRGYRVVEQGVRWENSPSSRVNAIRDSTSMLLDVVKLRLRR